MSETDDTEMLSGWVDALEATRTWLNGGECRTLEVVAEMAAAVAQITSAYAQAGPADAPQPERPTHVKLLTTLSDAARGLHEAVDWAGPNPTILGDDGFTRITLPMAFWEPAAAPVEDGPEFKPGDVVRFYRNHFFSGGGQTTIVTRGNYEIPGGGPMIDTEMHPSGMAAAYYTLVERPVPPPSETAPERSDAATETVSVDLPRAFVERRGADPTKVGRRHHSGDGVVLDAACAVALAAPASVPAPEPTLADQLGASTVREYENHEQAVAAEAARLSGPAPEQQNDAATGAPTNEMVAERNEDGSWSVRFEDLPAPPPSATPSRREEIAIDLGRPRRINRLIDDLTNEVHAAISERNVTHAALCARPPAPVVSDEELGRIARQTPSADEIAKVAWAATRETEAEWGDVVWEDETWPIRRTYLAEAEAVIAAFFSDGES